MKNSISKFAIIATLAITASACSKDDNGGGLGVTASLTFVNAAEGSAAQDVYVNDAKASASAVAYGSSSMSTITSGDKMVSFRNTGTTTASATGSVAADMNTPKTVFLVKQADGSMVISTYNNERTTTSGKAKVRFINVAPRLSASLNVVTSTGTSLVTALGFKAASAYQTVDAATSFNVTATGSLEMTTIAGSEIQAGKIYTIWFDSTTATKANYYVIVEN